MVVMVVVVVVAIVVAVPIIFQAYVVINFHAYSKILAIDPTAVGRPARRASAQRSSHAARHHCCYNALARRPATHADHDATRPTDCAESQSQRPNAWGDNPCPLAQLYLEEPANANRLDELPLFYFNTRPIDRIGCRDPIPSWRPTAVGRHARN